MTSSKDSEMLRSNFLIHWTGKDIQTDYKALCDTQRQEYIHRLYTTLDRDSGGLWMMPVDEEFILEATAPGSSSHYTLQYNEVPSTSFTEIKLSNVGKHTEKYGCLGFGFTRCFVIKQCGQPVQYVSINSPIVRNIFKLRNGLEGEMKEFLEFNICFLKNMSSCSSRPQRFDNYDEAEWRILFMKDEDKKQQPNVVFCGNSMRPMVKVKFKPCNLKILILPDDKTRQQVLNPKDAVGKYILDWLLESPTGLPVIATVGECLQF